MTEQFPRENIVQQIEPLPAQKIFMYNVLQNPKAKFNWYCGGFGSGKTYIGSQLAVRLAMMAPNGRGLIGRSTLVDLKATTMKTFFEVCDRRLIAKWNKSENLLTFINGHEIYFWGLDDIEKLKSLELGWFWMDEVDEVQEICFRVAQGRLRNKHQPKRTGYITSNSEGKNWTCKIFVYGLGIKTEKDLEKYYIVKAPSNENIHLPEDYLDVLNSYTGDLYQRYVLASFDVFEGQIFPEFRRDMHVIKPFAIPQEWKRYRGIDHGERNPTAVMWVAEAPNGDVFIHREHHQSQKTVAWHADKVAEASEGEYIRYSVLDPSTKSVRGTTGKKIDKEWKDELRMREEDVHIRYGTNSYNARIARWHAYLAVNKKKKHFVTGKMGAPSIYIFDTCPILIDQLETYKWAKERPTNENDPEEKPRKKDDHGIDAVSYVLLSLRHNPASVREYANERDPYKVLKPSKRDQVLPGHITDKEIMENMRRLHPEDFILK